MATSFGVHSNDAASVGSSCFGEASGSSCSHAAKAADDYRILQPGDFKRVKSQMSLRSRRCSGMDTAFDLPSSPQVPSSSNHNNAAGPSSDASLLPPDFDLVIPSRSHQLAQRQSRDRATFGPSDQDSDFSDEEPIGSMPTELADHDSDAESMVAAHDAAMPSKPSATALATSSPSLSSMQDAHLHQLKQEAEEVWASHRSGMLPQQRTPQPANIPQPISSTRRSSLVVLNAFPSSDAEQPRSSVATASTQSHSSSHSAKLNSEMLPRLSASVSHGSGTHWRGLLSSDLHFHRPYTASILSSTSERSFLSYQHSFESGMSPLLLERSAASTRVLGRPQRPATSGSIPLNVAGASHFATTPRPDTINQLSAEERRQQVRRTKKLTQMLGEEMLLASSAVHNDSHSPHARSDTRVRSRPQSRQFGADVASAPISASTTGSKTRALSRKLLHNRSHGVKSLDRAFSSDMVQPPPQAPAGLNRKAAAVLGIPHHPYSSCAQTRNSDEELLASDDELNVMRHVPARSFIPSGLEEFNEPTPKVAQLAAFSAAALDEGASPTLPHDGVFRAFDQSHLDHALAMSESRKLAAARDERRRRVAKMSRWLGEAVPAELIMAGADQRLNAVIRSTGAAAASSHQSSTSHDSGLYTASETGRTRRSLPIASVYGTSSVGHSSMSHEGSVASNLQSFISIDSSDDEADDEVAPAVQSRASPIQHVAVENSAMAPSPSIAASPLPDSVSAYRTSLDSYEVLLNENDHERLTELASIFHDNRVAASGTATTKRVPNITRPPRSSARPRTSPAALVLAPPTSRRPLDIVSDSQASQPALLSSSVGGIPRRSAAFLDLTDSESDSSDADEELHDIDDVCYSSALRQQRLDSHDRSISKLSSFFGSTPSQIVRSQTDIAAASSADSIVGLKDTIKSNKLRTARKSQPDALKTMLKSLEEEALDDSKLTHVQKSEISRKVHLLKRRTTKMFA